MDTVVLGNCVTRFEGEFSFLSNFYPCEVVHSSIKYPSAEHAYQASKTSDIGKRMKIAALPTAVAAKRAGRRLKLDTAFELGKVAEMHAIVYKKFAQNRDLKALLIATGNRFLIEGNWWGDELWGICAGKGRNHLGIILMDVREALSL